MRRKNQEITDRNAIDAIIGRALVCRVAMSENDQPYVVPLCFGYDGRNLYFHSSGKGRKVEILKKNPHVCFEFEDAGELEKADKACDWGMEYRSIIGFGEASFVDDVESKRKALDIIMKQYSEDSFEYPTKMIEAITIIRIDIEEITGKHSS